MSNHDEEILAKQRELDAAYAELKANRNAAKKGDTFDICNIDMYEGRNKPGKPFKVIAGKGKEYVIPTLEGKANEDHVGVKAKESKDESKREKGESK